MRVSVCLLAIAAVASSGFSQLSTGGTSDSNNIDYATARFERVVEARRVTERIAIDGKLDEKSWNLAQPATNFIQWEPNPGAPASENTQVRFLYDSDNLYVGAFCYDSEPDQLVINELKEDFSGQDDDGLGFLLDTLHDRRSGFVFGTNAAGAKRDIQVANDGTLSNMDWDGVWDVKVTHNEKGWVAEFVIPFKTLRFSNAESQEWGLNIYRRVRRKNEDSHWSPLPRRYRVNRASMAGTLKGLEGISQGRNFKVKPFAVAGMTEIRSNGRMQREYDYDGGVDVKYGLTSQLTLDATYRTDFAQVEVDQQQVNLTRFNLFFPEKREFFLENTGIFAFGQPISMHGEGGGMGGRGPGGGGNLIPFFSRRIGLASDGTPIPIIGGARISGKAGTYDVGLLGMKTESPGGLPSNNFLVGRVKKNLLENSWVGALLTSRDSSQPSDYNRVYGVDARFRFFEKLELGSFLMRSRTPGKSGKDQARQFDAGWLDNDLSITASHHEVQENFNPEMGFIRRKNTEITNTNFSWRTRTPGNRHIRNFFFNTGIDYFADGRGKIETREQDLSAGVFFQNGAHLSFRAARTFDRLSKPFAIRSNLSIPAGDYSYDDFQVFYTSDRSRRIGGSLRVNFGEFWNGRRNSYGVGLDLKPNHHLNIDLNFDRNQVRLPNGSFTTNLLGSRILYAFTSKVFLNAFLQYNTDARQFSSNIRFHIIHHPLSDLFIVYTDRRDTISGQLLDRAMVVKFTQLFNF